MAKPKQVLRASMVVKPLTRSSKDRRDPQCHLPHKRALLTNKNLNPNTLSFSDPRAQMCHMACKLAKQAKQVRQDRQVLMILDIRSSSARKDLRCLLDRPLIKESKRGPNSLTNLRRQLANRWHLSILCQAAIKKSQQAPGLKHHMVSTVNQLGNSSQKSKLVLG